jgi:hypothetical protein
VQPIPFFGSFRDFSTVVLCNTSCDVVWAIGDDLRSYNPV